jgi:hypothetical protein
MKAIKFEKNDIHVSTTQCQGKNHITFRLIKEFCFADLSKMQYNNDFLEETTILKCQAVIRCSSSFFQKIPDLVSE